MAKKSSIGQSFHDQWEEQHLLLIDTLEKKIKAIYNKAVKESASIAASTPNFSPDKPFTLESYPSVGKKINTLLEGLKSDVQTAIVNGVDSQWTLANNKNNALCDLVFGEAKKNLSDKLAKKYYTNNDAALKSFIERKTAGMNLSDRVWNMTDQFQQELEMALDLGLRDGVSAAEMSRYVRQYLNNPTALFRRVADEHGNLHLSKNAKAYHPGQGVYRSAYKNTLRLTATENNMAYRTADYLRWQQMDFVVGIRISLSNNHTLNGKPFVDMCDYLVGNYPKDYKFVGWHPFCRCFATPILKSEDEMFADNERIMQGKEPNPASKSKGYISDTPKGYKTWIKDNQQRIEKAKNTPYYAKDNKAYVESAFSGKPVVSAKTARTTSKAPSAAELKAIEEAARKQAIQDAATKRHASRDAGAIQRVWDERKAMMSITDANDLRLVVEPLKNAKSVQYNNVELLGNNISEEEIISRLGGGDKTNGSCSTLGFAYAGNKGGFDVLDFRGGESQMFFSSGSNVNKIIEKAGGFVESGFDDFKTINKMLSRMEVSKQYYFANHAHAAIVRKLESGAFEYLELQSATSNGWKSFTTSSFRSRFAAKKSRSLYGQKVTMRQWLVDIEDLYNNPTFREMLGYINTNSNAQLKGLEGTIK